MNSAVKLPYWHKGDLSKNDDHSVPLDYIQGAGMLNALAAYEQLTAGQKGPEDVPDAGWDNNILNSGNSNVYRFTVEEPNDKIVSTTLVWNKNYKDSYPFEAEPEKDSNLRLELWAVDIYEPNQKILLDHSDSLSDNVEHIYYTIDSNYTDFEIIVSNSSNIDPNQEQLDQQYGLAWGVNKSAVIDKINWYDLNADGIVNKIDFNIMMNNLLKSIEKSNEYLQGDINLDGRIDFNDLKTLQDQKDLKSDWHKEDLQ